MKELWMGIETIDWRCLMREEDAKKVMKDTTYTRPLAYYYVLRNLRVICYDTGKHDTLLH